VNSKDLSTAGTKDKRAVTTQHVTLKRAKRTLENVWDRIHASRDRGRKADKQTERGERGLRIADLEYVQEPLELGMLQGNRFSIALR
jgi:tRNA pseudouridine13 synthase